jgi:hypothetical protein
MPAHWLRRPELRTDAETLTAFDRLLGQALAQGPGQPLEYRLDVPKWQFLCHAAERANLVLHGSGNPGIELFEPRQPDDPGEFSGRRAVYAAADGIWPMYFAILDRERYPMGLLNACVRVRPASGELSGPYYFFSITATALAQRPWRSGTVYLLPAGSFETQPPVTVGDVHVKIAQVASPVPVRPAARLTVEPEDFPFLRQIRGHDNEMLQARFAADPDGFFTAGADDFPWVEQA